MEALVTPTLNGGVESAAPNQSAIGLTLAASFTGIDITSGTYAADTTMGVGPTVLVLATNAGIAIRTKTGSPLAFTDLLEFFAALREPGENAGDPRVVFDPESGRFFVAATGRVLTPSCAPGACVAHFFLAVSKSASPTSLDAASWYRYRFDATLDGAAPTDAWADFTSLGVNHELVVLSAGMIRFSSGKTEYGKIRLLPKSPLLRGEPVTWIDFVKLKYPSSPDFAINFQPALALTRSDTFFLLSPPGVVSCGLTVWAIMGGVTSPSIAAETLSAPGQCDAPPNAPQPNGPSLFIGNRFQLGHTAHEDGFLWTTRTVAAEFGGQTVSAIRWYQVDVRSWPTVGLAQTGVLGIDEVWHGYGAIMGDAIGNAVIVYLRSSPTEFASVYYSGRLATDPPSTLRPGTLLKAGSASLSTFQGGVARWADYSTVARDPVDGSAWIFGEYIRAPDAWGTWVGNVPWPPFAVLNSSGTSFSAGQTLFLTVRASNPAGGQPLDLYVGALWPDGNTIAFLAAPNVFGGLGQYSAPASVAPMLVLNGGAAVNTAVLEYTFPADGIPVGTYHVFASLFRHETLADNALEDGDLVWLDYFPLTYRP